MLYMSKDELVTFMDSGDLNLFISYKKYWSDEL